MKFGVYEVKVVQRANCRRMILRCSRDQGMLTLSVPKGTTQAAIREFLSASRAWIDKQMNAPAPWQPSYVAGERHWVFGRQVTLGMDVPEGEAYLRWRNQQLLAVLRHMLVQWTARMGVHVTHVTLQEMTSRWGSCRPKTGRLTFNTKLAMYSEWIIEETVVHELCHFFHGNHSAAFYAELTKWLPDWKARKAQRDKADVRPQPPLCR